MTIPREWWDRWRKEDWSWEGLAKKRWIGWIVLGDGSVRLDKQTTTLERDEDRMSRLPDHARLATLQDYWRAEENSGRLIASPYGRYTDVHLPPTWQNGDPTGKGDWAFDRLDRILLRELERSAAWIREFGVAHANLCRAQLQGAVLTCFDLRGIAPPEGDPAAPVSIAADFTGAAFLSDTSFFRAAFSGEASFADAAFSGAASFQSAAFSSDACFERTTFFGDALFRGVAFSDEAFFPDSDFRSTALFEDAVFSSEANFERAAFYHDARFWNAAFASNARFMNVAFSRNAEFHHALFLRNADFRGVGRCLDQSGGVQEVKLRSAASSAALRQIAGTMSKSAGIDSAARGSVGRFVANGAIFLGDADFSNRDIVEGPSSAQSDFHGAQFFGLARFQDADLHSGINFATAYFEAALNRADEGFDPFTVLAGNPVFELGLSRLAQAGITRASRDEGEVQWVNQLRRELVAEWRALRAMNAGRPGPRSDYLRALEDCFRTLKQFNEERRDRLEEARFFRLELLARSKRDIPGRPVGDRFLTFCYRWFSDFGTSIFRPLLIAVATIPLFAIVYMLMGARVDSAPSLTSFMDALVFSAARLFPLGPWAEPDACSAIGGMIGLPAQTGTPCEPVIEYVYGTPFLVGLIATLQSLLAIVFFFLSGLAIRRRFQID